VDADVEVGGANNGPNTAKSGEICPTPEYPRSLATAAKIGDGKGTKEVIRKRISSYYHYGEVLRAVANAVANAGCWLLAAGWS
jgi:hypothetical protein